MAGPGRIYRRGLIYYIAYRWDGREYRESARSAHVAAAERLLATRLAERQGHARSRALTFDALAAWYLDDYAVRRLRTLNTARGRVANLRAVFTGWQATVITSEAVRTYQRTRRAAGAAAATVNREISALSPMVQLAVRGGVVRLSPERSKTRVGRVLPISAPIRAVLARRRAQRRGRDPRVFRPDAVTVRAWRTAWPAAIRAAQAVPGYRRDSEGSRARHVVDTPLPFADPDTWQRLRAVIDTVGQWKASVVQIGGRLCWPLWRGVHELDEVLTCFHRRPAGARGAGYCAGQETPTADATAWDCRFVRGVDLEAWGHRHAPWYHFVQLTDDHTRFVARVGGEWLCGALRRARSVQAWKWQGEKGPFGNVKRDP